VGIFYLFRQGTSTSSCSNKEPQSQLFFPFQTPRAECVGGHDAYVLALAWAPDHKGRLAAGEGM